MSRRSESTSDAIALVAMLVAFFLFLALGACTDYHNCVANGGKVDHSCTWHEYVQSVDPSERFWRYDCIDTCTPLGFPAVPAEELP